MRCHIVELFKVYVQLQEVVPVEQKIHKLRDIHIKKSINIKRHFRLVLVHELRE